MWLSFTKAFWLHTRNTCTKKSFCSILLGMILALKPDGIEVNGVLLRSDTASGNLNFSKGIEGFLESFPKSINQISIHSRPRIKRTILKARCINCKFYNSYTQLCKNLLLLLYPKLRLIHCKLFIEVKLHI